MKNRLRNFMMGRYGVDDLSRFLMGFGVIAMLLSTIFRIGFLYFISILILFLCYFRIFSRNHNKRYSENMRFLKYKNGFFEYFKKEKYYMQQRKTHHIYKCPSCSQRIRIPKGKGRISISCPKCRTDFIKKS